MKGPRWAKKDRAFNTATRCRSRDERGLPGHVADNVSRHFGVWAFGRDQQVDCREQGVGLDRTAQDEYPLAVIVDQAQGRGDIQSVPLGIPFLRLHHLCCFLAFEAGLQSRGGVGVLRAAGQSEAIALGVQKHPDHGTPERLAPLQLAYALGQFCSTAGRRFVLG